MTQSTEHKTYFLVGIGVIVIGTVTAIVGTLVAHFTGLSETDELGAEIYPAIPRGWALELLGQVVALGGVLLVLGGIAIAFLYGRQMTWARAAIGAFLFTALMMILFGIVPNQWLTLTQATWEWTTQRIFLTVPPWLVLGNEVEISYAVLKDVVSGTYNVVVLGAVAVGMYQWQERAKKAATAPPPEPVSAYGRPLAKVDQ